MKKIEFNIRIREGQDNKEWNLINVSGYRLKDRCGYRFAVCKIYGNWRITELSSGGIVKGFYENIKMSEAIDWFENEFPKLISNEKVKKAVAEKVAEYGIANE